MYSYITAFKGTKGSNERQPHLRGIVSQSMLMSPGTENGICVPEPGLLGVTNCRILDKVTLDVHGSQIPHG